MVNSNTEICPKNAIVHLHTQSLQGMTQSHGYEAYWFHLIVESGMVGPKGEGGKPGRKGQGLEYCCRPVEHFHTSWHIASVETPFLPCADILLLLCPHRSVIAQAPAPSLPSSCALPPDP